MSALDCGGRPLDLNRVRVMGILNVTPDSFSDGGRYCCLEAAVEHARAMVAAGADLIDVGGESTRPGAAPVSLAQELARVIPVVTALAQSVSVPISVDTYKPEVMHAAVAAGAGLINDVCALRAPGALDTAARLGVPVCLMHMVGDPLTMQLAPDYTDVATQVRAFLNERLEACRRAGIPHTRLLIDPGFGFGKTLEHNLRLLANLSVLTDLEVPVLVGLSRKSMVGTLTGRAPAERLAASLAAALLAVARGAAILRVHDVAETRDALCVWEAVTQLAPAA
ncbi:dihydropteroate synthase [uncultured Thiodictyon sp.]|uniref:dihydropteroate synthase n=1 Tax=uncultured Thiodictyon sp. TaxID=1846217 RepID=UPI0025FFA4AA|nr:dihydropteroate synthase [uncultured Thiodictyon sp.]